MIKSRKALGALAVGLMGAGVLGACAPAPAPAPGPAGPSDTKNVTMSCVLSIYDNGIHLFDSPKDYTVTLTLASADVAVGANAAYTATVSGVTNGPLPSASGTFTAEVSTGGGASVDSTGGGAIGAAPGNGPLPVSAMTGDTTAINGDTTVTITGYHFHAVGTNPNPGDNDWADGTCTLDPGENPTITVGNI